MGPDDSRVMCTCEIFLHLHLTCGTRQLACHLYLLCRRGLINSKKTSMPGSQTRDPEEGMHGLYHCARCLVVLTCLRGHYSIIFSVWMAYRLTYIGYFPFKWKQICAHLTSGGGGGGSLVCCGGSGFLLEARRWGLPVERGGIGVHVCRVPQQRR